MELGKQISLISFAWQVLVVRLFLIYEVSIYINVLCCNLASKPPTRSPITSSYSLLSQKVNVCSLPLKAWIPLW